MGRKELPELFAHFDIHHVSLSLVSTDWIVSVLLNFIPLELSHLFLDLFVRHGWPMFYSVCLTLLRFYQRDLLKMRDAG